MKNYVIGEMYEEFEVPGILFDINYSVVKLVVNEFQIDDEVVNEFQNGKIQYKVTKFADALWTAWKFGDYKWLDVPFHAKFADAFVLPFESMRVTMFFANASTGELKVIRDFSLSRDATDFIYKMIDKQKKSKVTEERYYEFDEEAEIYDPAE